MMTIPSPQRSTLRWLPSLIGVIALLSLALGGCTAQVNSVQKAQQQTFVYPNTGAKHPLPLWDGTSKRAAESGLHLDPAYVVDLYSLKVMAMTQVQLFTFDANMNRIDDAAQSWEKSTDGTTYTIHLRTDMKWSDGTPLTAQDFVAGMQHDLDPNLCTEDSPLNNSTASLRKSCAGGQYLLPYLTYVQGATAYASATPDPKTGKPPATISGISMPDNYTLVFKLTAPIVFFLDELATTVSVPIEASALKQYGGNYPNDYASKGISQSGPFRIRAWQDPLNPSVSDPQHATQIDFVPNPHWWGKPVQLQQVIMPLYEDLNAQYDQYAKPQTVNQADYATVPPHDYTFVQNLNDFHEVKALDVNYYSMNFANPPFDNLQVRQAFALALNKQSLVDIFYQGSSLPTNHIIPDGVLGYDPNLVSPPDISTGTATLTGNQKSAQTLIASVAKGCEADYNNDWCPYIIGKQGNGATLTSVGTVLAGRTCPNYNVLATTNGTTQQQIVSWAPSDNPDRDLLNGAAAQQWANVLCLNVVSNEAIHQPITFNRLTTDVFGNAGSSTPQPTPEAIYTFGGYIADYPDPQDYTSNQFLPGSSNNTVNFGVKPLSNEDTLVAQMNQADTTTDTAKRIQLYQQIEQQLVFQVAWLPTDQPKLIYRLQPYVMNFALPANGCVSDQSWSDVYIAAHN